MKSANKTTSKKVMWRAQSRVKLFEWVFYEDKYKKNLVAFCLSWLIVVFSAILSFFYCYPNIFIKYTFLSSKCVMWYYWSQKYHFTPSRWPSKLFKMFRLTSAFMTQPQVLIANSDTQNCIWQVLEQKKKLSFKGTANHSLCNAYCLCLFLWLDFPPNRCNVNK